MARPHSNRFAYAKCRLIRPGWPSRMRLGREATRSLHLPKRLNRAARHERILVASQSGCEQPDHPRFHVRTENPTGAPRLTKPPARELSWPERRGQCELGGGAINRERIGNRRASSSRDTLHKLTFHSPPLRRVSVHDLDLVAINNPLFNANVR